MIIEHLELCLTMDRFKPVFRNCLEVNSQWIYLSESKQLIETNSLQCLTILKQKIVAEDWNSQRKESNFVF